MDFTAGSSGQLHGLVFFESCISFLLSVSPPQPALQANNLSERVTHWIISWIRLSLGPRCEQSASPILLWITTNIYFEQTEGVWMSVTPTHDCLVVALDFEGELHYVSSQRLNVLYDCSRCTLHWKESSRRCIACKEIFAVLNDFPSVKILVGSFQHRNFQFGNETSCLWRSTLAHLSLGVVP